MIPYWRFPLLRVGPVAISWPLFLAAAGVLIAHFLLLRRARQQGLDGETAAMMSLVMVLVGLVAAYWFRGFYLSDAVKQDWHVLLGLQYGAASFGGIAGGLLAGWGYLAARRYDGGTILRYLDALAFVFPMGWIVGRSGCVLAHDHPGRPTGSFLGVRYPAPVTVTIGGQPADVLYYGAAPQAVSGLLQVNAKVPDSIAAGDVEVVIQVGAAKSQTGLTVAVR